MFFNRLFMNFGLAAAVHFRELRPLELTTSCTSPLFLWIWLTCDAGAQTKACVHLCKLLI